MKKKEVVKEIKQPRTIPKCPWANWKYCWQRNSDYKTYASMQLYYVIDEKKCAACLSAYMVWGEGADHRPQTKEEMKKELEALKNGQSKKSA